MFRLALALLLGSTMLAHAQQEEIKYFYTKQDCYPLSTFMNTVVNNYKEQALFTGSGLTVGADGTPFNGGVMFFVNQDTGTWTLATLYTDGTACINGVGSDFEPYTD